MPHPPQLLEFVAVLTQLPLHNVGLAEGQAQTLFWQVWPMGQALPHAPQL